MTGRFDAIVLGMGPGGSVSWYSRPFGRRGMDVRLGRQARRVVSNRDGARVDLDDGEAVEVDVIVLGTGRRPRVQDLGLETVGIDVAAWDGRGIPVDEHCRFGDGLWAVGDVTGQALFTHVAKYQGRVAADTICGRPRRACYDGIPRVIFADPEIAAVGMTGATARDRGVEVATSEVDLPATISRRGPTKPSHEEPSAYWSTGTGGSWSAPGRSPPLLESRSTKPPSPSGPRCRSTPSSIRSLNSRPTPRRTCPPWSR
jgi:NADPH-dependent 2,4-dienoyl-CoA reductase/sulfur reductase-like enzyme